MNSVNSAPKSTPKEDLTTQFKIAFLEEYVGINEFDFNNVPSVLIEYYIELKLKDLV
ncbi:MAG: hypothetical protein ACTSRS_08980 [Candidatus Helarchaeota archaeon]